MCYNYVIEKSVMVMVDRPLDSYHPMHKDLLDDKVIAAIHRNDDIEEEG